MSDAPVLVTGSHRSGTTWVGRMLCASGEAAYVHEPFNVGLDAGWLVPPAPHWYQHVSAANEAEFAERVDRVFGLRYPVTGRALRPATPRRLARIGREAWRAAHHRRAGRRVLVKDPLALLSTEWLAARYGAVPVIMVRHPAAFVSSLLRMGWEFDFAEWAEQPLLMEGLLAPFADEIEQRRRQPGDIVEQGCVMWRAIHHVIDGYRQAHPDWHVLRHEDVAAEPMEHFTRLYAALGLHLDEVARATIHAHSSAPVREVAAGDLGTIARDSRAAISTWRGRLSSEQVDRVRRAVGEEADRFYEPSTWAAPRA